MTDASDRPTPSAYINPPPRVRHRPRADAADAAASLVPAQALDKEKEGYEVGYGKPPVHSRFRPGMSGNRKGRPKKAKGLNTIVREQMLESILVRTERGERRIPRVQALFVKMIEKGAKGDLRALEKLLHLYALAVPDAASPTEMLVAPGQPSPSDEASLALLREIFAEDYVRNAQLADDQ
jgi:hypothetical protein